MTLTRTSLDAAGGQSASGQFVRFCVVGVIGFIVDAGILEGLFSIGRLPPIEARFLSFACAVLTTFALNRRWSFKGADLLAFWPTLVGYLGVQGAGFLCNITIYSLLYLFAPSPINRPLYSLILASGISMLVNFFGARVLVFRSRRRHRHRCS